MLPACPPTSCPLPAGANLANGWMARPGASIIELIPYQFETGRGAFVFSSTNAQVRCVWAGSM